ncbi:MAG TPA: TSUP family transporter [Kineosporiaceae bacterium]|nr:TSUP family transporter [Kineosporiaceae bacterium]
MTVDGLPLLTAGLLALAALVAGWVDAMVGGGGLVQLPALLLGLPAAPPAQLLATNKLASVCGTATSAVAYQRRVRPDLRTALPMAGLALGGAAAGAACASLLPTRVFRPLVLVMLVLVAVYVARRPELGRITDLRFSGRRHHLTAGVVGAGIGFYDGIFGPGTGSFLVVALVGLLGYAFLQASAKAKIVNLATNLGALLVFVPQGAPLWRLGLLMGAANLGGGYLGARTAVAAGNRFIRVALLVVVGVLVVRVGWDVAHGR